MKSVNDVAKIADPMSRMVAAADLAREAESKADVQRERRDLAILVMLRPFADAVANTNAERNRLRDQRDRFKITEEQYVTALAENREQRQSDIDHAQVKVYPADIYKMLGVSRNLVNRILMRMPVEDLPEMRSPKRTAQTAHSKIGPLQEIVAQAREIRDAAALLVMAGEDDNGNPVDPVSNAEIARATQLTTARVAQLRTAVR